MAVSRDDIFKGALTLNPSDRADLIGVLIRSLDAVNEEGVEEAWRAEVERRARELESGAVKTIPWEVVRERLAREYGPEYDQLVGLLSEAREEVRAQGLGTEHLDWKQALDSGILELIRAGRLEAAKERLRACLSSSSD